MLDKKQTLQKVIALNASLVMAEIIAGIYSGSMSLIADAFHNLGDVLSLFISLIAIIYGAKKASESMTFGYIKAEIMAAFINSLLLIITMIFILVESINRFLNPTEINALVVVFTSLIALFINAYSSILLKQNRMEHNHEDEDMNIKSAYLNMLGDSVISLSVAVGGVIIYFFGVFAIDSVLSIIFSIFIIKETFPLLKKSFYSLMDSNIDNLKQIENLIINSDSSILSIHDLHLYRPNSKEWYGSVHLVLNGNLTLVEIEVILENIRFILSQNGITHFIIQPESDKYNNSNSSFCNHL